MVWFVFSVPLTFLFGLLASFYTYYMLLYIFFGGCLYNTFPMNTSTRMHIVFCLCMFNFGKFLFHFLITILQPTLTSGLVGICIVCVTKRKNKGCVI